MERRSISETKKITIDKGSRVFPIINVPLSIPVIKVEQAGIKFPDDIDFTVADKEWIEKRKYRNITLENILYKCRCHHLNHPSLTFTVIIYYLTGNNII